MGLDAIHLTPIAIDSRLDGLILPAPDASALALADSVELAAFALALVVVEIELDALRQHLVRAGGDSHGTENERLQCGNVELDALVLIEDGGNRRSNRLVIRFVLGLSLVERLTAKRQELILGAALELDLENLLHRLILLSFCPVRAFVTLAFPPLLDGNRELSDTLSERDSSRTSQSLAMHPQ